MRSICGARSLRANIACAFGLICVVLLILVGSFLLLADPSDDSDLVISIIVLSMMIAGVLAFWTFLWISIWMLQNCMICCFPVACGHSRCFFNGVINCQKRDFRQILYTFTCCVCGNKTERRSAHLREILLSVDKAVPTEEQLQEFQESLQYLNDIKAALKKKMAADEFQYVFSGSVVERYGIPVMMLYENVGRRATLRALRSIAPLDADLDVMFCSSLSGQGSILVEPLDNESEGFSGYVQLKCITPSAERTSISSKLIKQKARDVIRTMPVDNLPGCRCCFANTHFPCLIRIYSKGPAMKVFISDAFEIDITVSVKCPEWPPMSDWPSRPRYWPSVDDAQRIISLGCHLVPKSAPNDKKKESWRFSFSLAEVELSKLVPDTARKCFLALKIIVKDHLQPVVPGMIKSYHIKTIFYNTLEKVPVGFWIESKIEECFLTLLAELHDALLSMKCPHHWFSSINLFGHIEVSSCSYIKTIRLQRLAKKVQTIMKNPAPFLFYEGCCCLSTCCFPAPPYNFTRLTNEQLVAEYEEVMLSADGHVIPREQPLYSNSLPRSTEYNTFNV